MRRHTGPSGKLLPGGLAIIHEDRDLIVVDKPAGLLTISMDREKSRTAFFILADYVRESFLSPRIVFSSVQYSTFELRLAN